MAGGGAGDAWGQPPDALQVLRCRGPHASFARLSFLTPPFANVTAFCVAATHDPPQEAVEAVDKAASSLAAPQERLKKLLAAQVRAAAATAAGSALFH